MPRKKAPRLYFDDWHHERCAQDDDCLKRVCRIHKRIYWSCQDHVFEKALNYFSGAGECIACKRHAYMTRQQHEMGLLRRDKRMLA